MPAAETCSCWGLHRCSSINAILRMPVVIKIYCYPTLGTCCTVYSIQQRKAMLQLRRTHLQTQGAASMNLRVCIIAEELTIQNRPMHACDRSQFIPQHCILLGLRPQSPHGK
jgi:hypothetical protein